MIRHIELLGLPASGKTTLLKALNRELVARNRMVIAPLKGAPNNLSERWDKFLTDTGSVRRLTLESPKHAIRIWRACLALEQPTNILQLRMILNCLRVESLARTNRARMAADSIIAFDQGLYQAIWSLALRAAVQSGEELAAKAGPLLKLLTLPDLVILVDTPADIVRQRLSGHHGRLRTLLEEDPGWLETAVGLLDGVWGLAREQQALQTFRVFPNETAINDLVQIITGEIPCRGA